MTKAEHGTNESQGQLYLTGRERIFYLDESLCNIYSTVNFALKNYYFN